MGGKRAAATRLAPRPKQPGRREQNSPETGGDGPVVVFSGRGQGEPARMAALTGGGCRASGRHPGSAEGRRGGPGGKAQGRWGEEEEEGRAAVRLPYGAAATQAKGAISGREGGGGSGGSAPRRRLLSAGSSQLRLINQGQAWPSEESREVRRRRSSLRFQLLVAILIPCPGRRRYAWFPPFLSSRFLLSLRRLSAAARPSPPPLEGLLAPSFLFCQPLPPRSLRTVVETGPSTSAEQAKGRGGGGVGRLRWSFSYPTPGISAP